MFQVKMIYNYKLRIIFWHNIQKLQDNQIENKKVINELFKTVIYELTKSKLLQNKWMDFYMLLNLINFKIFYYF